MFSRRSIFPALSLSLWLVSSIISPAAGTPDQVFESLRGAIGDRNGSLAAQHVSESTFTRYAQCLEMALTGTPDQLETLNVAQIVTVFQTRIALSEDEILDMTGEDFFAYAVDQGLISLSSLTGFTLQNLQFPGMDDAVAVLVRHGNVDKKVHIHFRSEEDGWKVNLSNLLSIMDPVLERLRLQKRMSRTAYARLLISNQIGAEVPPHVLRPVSSKL